MKTNQESQSLDLRMDSLDFELNTSEKGSEQYKSVLNQYYRFETAASDKLEVMIAESDEKIWKLLNKYFKEFGKLKNIKVLLGGKADGSVLYIDDSLNLTEEFLDFANSKYEGE